ncbi:MAG: hypothetical protein AB8G05_22185 [Oligoflexales bacterium]
MPRKKPQIPHDVAMELKDNLVDYRGQTEFTRGKSERSWRRLSDKIQVSRTRLSQLANWNERDQVDFINADDVLALQGFFGGFKSMNEIIDNSSPTIKNYLAVNKPRSYKAPYAKQRMVAIPTSLLFDFENFLILFLASNGKTDVDYVFDMVGKNAIDKVTELENQGFVGVLNDKLVIAGGGYAKFPLEVINLHLPELEKRFFSDGEYSVLHYLFYATTPKGIKRLNGLLNEFIAKATEILEEEEEEGDIPVFLNCWFDQLSKG